MSNLRTSKKTNNDFNQLDILHKYLLSQNSPKTTQNLTSKSKRNNIILLEKTVPNMNLPTYIKFSKKNNNDYSQNSENNKFTYSNLSINNINLSNLLKKNKNSFIKDLSLSKIRRSKISNEKNYTNYKDEYGAIKLNKFLKTSHQEVNEIENDDIRNKRIITISPSHSSKKDNSNKPKNKEINIKNEKEGNENNSNDDNSKNNNDNFNKKHKMRYLLSKNYCGKRPIKRKYMNISPFSIKNKRNSTNETTKLANSINKINYPKKTRNLRLDIDDNDLRANTNLEEKKMKNYINLMGTPGTTTNINENNRYQVNTKREIVNKFISKKQTQDEPSLIPIKSSYILQNYNKINNNKNIIKEEIQLNDNNIFLNEDYNKNFNNNEIEIKLDDLIFIEGRLNDIMTVLNNKKNIFDVKAMNETSEYFTFYFNSTLMNKFPLFFNPQNKIIIKSAFNLNLFTILLTYHLSANASMLLKVLIILKNIYELIKVNFYIFIRKIEIYYGDDYCKKNDIYFKTFNYFFNEKKLFNLNEKEIINIINKNCVKIVNEVKKILNYYKTINNKYYSEFQDIYFNISKLSEQDICNYFYKNIYNISDESENEIIQPKINIFSNNEKNIENNNENKSDKMKNKEKVGYLNSIIISYKKNKKIPPFIKLKNKKKYTVVLDLEETLVDIKIDDEGNLFCHQRPGLIPFLNGIKPFYEIISFTKLSKEHSDKIIEEIDGKKNLFDYNFYREHCSLNGTKFIKDIARIGRDMKKIILVDDLPENLKNHPNNGILISPYIKEDNDDKVLYELKKILTLFFKLGYEDLREAIKNYKDEIYNKITLGNI